MPGMVAQLDARQTGIQIAGLTLQSGNIEICHEITGVGLETSDSGKFPGFQGDVLVKILDFPICSIYLNFSLSSK